MNVILHDKTIEIRLSKPAKRALEDRKTPLLAEMELLFSCLIRKRVRFHELPNGTAIPVSERLSVSFRPVMTKACVLSELEGSTPLEDFPITNPRPYVPHWLSIDYRRGQWHGEFGYGSN